MSVLLTLLLLLHGTASARRAGVLSVAKTWVQLSCLLSMRCCPCWGTEQSGCWWSKHWGKMWAPRVGKPSACCSTVSSSGGSIVRLFWGRGCRSGGCLPVVNQDLNCAAVFSCKSANILCLSCVSASVTVLWSGHVVWCWAAEADGIDSYTCGCELLALLLSQCVKLVVVLLERCINFACGDAAAFVSLLSQDFPPFGESLAVICRLLATVACAYCHCCYGQSLCGCSFAPPPAWNFPWKCVGACTVEQQLLGRAGLQHWKSGWAPAQQKHVAPWAAECATGVGSNVNTAPSAHWACNGVLLVCVCACTVVAIVVRLQMLPGTAPCGGAIGGPSVYV